ncbi:hypothetical protein HAX54_051336 [Datura stramonium]|uniref:Uncharacterized protein n=1 Tax=Datura stramonium TaxID=4076 RepID=A0ABS8WPQ0_DATST|nr:hypothetical protein [Datura stramonium]
MTTPAGEKLEEIPPPSHKMQKTQLYFPPMKTLFLLLLFFHAQMRFCCGVSVLDLKLVKDSNFEIMGKRGCAEKIKECSEMVDEEGLMDSESNRRVLLMQKKYISYGTLKRDLVQISDALLRNKRCFLRHYYGNEIPFQIFTSI